MSHRLHELRMENDAAGFAMDEARPRFERMAARRENGTAPRSVSVYQLFQTPADLAARLVAVLDLQPGARILEPSAGLGRILDALQPFEPAEVVAIDNAHELTGEIFRQERERITILQRDFLTVTPEETGLFDAVAMNPPFHLRADIRHIEHARKFLKPGGRLVALCMAGPHRVARLKTHALQWIELKPGAFKESGTNIAAILLTMGAV